MLAAGASSRYGGVKQREFLPAVLAALRETSVTDQKLREAIHDPVVSGSFRDRERRASVSELLRSVQKQLVQQYEFINIAAHELRTPIMPILMNAEILQSTLSGRSKELDAIVRNAMRLQQLAENVIKCTRPVARTRTQVGPNGREDAVHRRRAPEA